MWVLIHTGTNGKVKIASYGSSVRAIEPIYSLLELIFSVQRASKSFGLRTICLIALYPLSQVQSSVTHVLRALMRAL